MGLSFSFWCVGLTCSHFCFSGKQCRLSMYLDNFGNFNLPPYIFYLVVSRNGNLMVSLVNTKQNARLTFLNICGQVPLTCRWQVPAFQQRIGWIFIKSHFLNMLVNSARVNDKLLVGNLINMWTKLLNIK